MAHRAGLTAELPGKSVLAPIVDIYHITSHESAFDLWYLDTEYIAQVLSILFTEMDPKLGKPIQGPTFWPYVEHSQPSSIHLLVPLIVVLMVL